MRRVLTAYALHSPEISYCQGMNVVVGMLLLVMKGEEELSVRIEEEAFQVFLVIVEELIPGYYAPGLPGLIQDQAIFERLMKSRHIPSRDPCLILTLTSFMKLRHTDLCENLESLGVPSSPF